MNGRTGDPGDVVGLKFTTQAIDMNAASCWGAANAQSPSVTVFRVNVLHLLPKLYNANNRWTGKRLVNDSDLVNNHDKNGVPYAASLATAGHSVTLREGQADQAAQSAGATLVVVYRTLDPNEKLRRIALYDGLHQQSQSVGGITQSLAGFYDNDGLGRMTMLVGSGNPNNSEVLNFNGAQINASDPFPKTGNSADRSWAFPTFNNLSMSGVQTAPGFGEYAQTVLTQSGGFDCKSWAAIIFSVPVLDADHDGLPDAVENSSTSGGQPWKNPDGQPVPDIHSMGARTDRRDIFAEINAMRTGGTYDLRFYRWPPLARLCAIRQRSRSSLGKRDRATTRSHPGPGRVENGGRCVWNAAKHRRAFRRRRYKGVSRGASRGATVPLHLRHHHAAVGGAASGLPVPGSDK